MRLVAPTLMLEVKAWLRYLLPSKYVAVYYPTPLHIARRMLALAQVTAADTVYDLGCGDGRILVLAAKEFGAKAVGVELDASLAAAAKASAQEAGLQERIRVIHGDLAAVDVRPATVLAMYLSDKGNSRLVQVVTPQLRPGARVVSLYFPIAEWQQQLLTKDVGSGIDIYVYKAPGSSRSEE